MSHGDKDFNTCNEFKDGGLAPDDPFHKIQSQTFDKPFMPSGKRQPLRLQSSASDLQHTLRLILLDAVCVSGCVCVHSPCQVTPAAGYTEQVSGIQGRPHRSKGGRGEAGAGGEES
jgi:hypothetical protein